MKQLDEKHIIEGLIRRDPATCKRVLEYFLPGFVAYVSKKFKGEKEEAISITHDALLDVMDKLAEGKFTWQGEHSFSKYFFTFFKQKTHNFYRDKNRAQKKTKTYPLDEKTQVPADQKDRATEEELITMDKENLLLHNHLNDCLYQLNKTDTQLITLRYLDGLPWDKIAELSGITTGNARTRYSRLLKKLRQCIERKLNN